MKIGDLVIKSGALDTGKSGIILEININSVGHKLLKILKEDGVLTTWYGNVVEVLSESRGLD
jgi:hypothetical protein